MTGTTVTAAVEVVLVAWGMVGSAGREQYDRRYSALTPGERVEYWERRAATAQSESEVQVCMFQQQAAERELQAQLAAVDAVLAEVIADEKAERRARFTLEQGSMIHGITGQQTEGYKVCGPLAHGGGSFLLGFYSGPDAEVRAKALLALLRQQDFNY